MRLRGPLQPSTRARLAAAVALASLSGCFHVHTVDTPDAVLVYGFIDTSASGLALGGVSLFRNVGEHSVPPHTTMEAEPDGLFYLENLPPGRYAIEGFTTGTAYNSFSAGGGSVKWFDVKPRSMHFVGAFKYRVVRDPGVFVRGRSAVTPASSPSRTEVLRRLQSKVKDPRWKRRIAAQLAGA